MAHFPTTSTRTRAPRVRIPNDERITLNLGEKRAFATLRLLSLTGGLVEFPAPMEEVTLAEVVLMTISGPVKALVEFMQAPRKARPAARPFRFIAIDDNDYQRLNSTLQLMLKQGFGA
jgi:hypothetical protein